MLLIGSGTVYNFLRCYAQPFWREYAGEISVVEGGTEHDLQVLSEAHVHDSIGPMGSSPYLLAMAANKQDKKAFHFFRTSHFYGVLLARGIPLEVTFATREPSVFQSPGCEVPGLEALNGACPDAGPCVDINQLGPWLWRPGKWTTNECGYRLLVPTGGSSTLSVLNSLRTNPRDSWPDDSVAFDLEMHTVQDELPAIALGDHIFDVDEKGIGRCLSIGAARRESTSLKTYALCLTPAGKSTCEPQTRSYYLYGRLSNCDKGECAIRRKECDFYARLFDALANTARLEGVPPALKRNLEHFVAQSSRFHRDCVIRPGDEAFFDIAQDKSMP